MTDFAVPRILEICFSIMKGESLVMGLEESSASITRKRGKWDEGFWHSESDSESDERARLAFFWDAMLCFFYSSPMLPTYHGAQQGDMVWGKPIRRP